MKLPKTTDFKSQSQHWDFICPDAQYAAARSLCAEVQSISSDCTAHLSVVGFGTLFQFCK